LKPLLFEAYPGLESIPWVRLGDFPTLIQRMEKLGEAKGFSSLYVKRDDLSSPTYGGNKVRKLEWVLADAREKGRKTLISVGGSGSNQVLATTIYGKQMGFRVVGLVFDQPNAEYVRRNLLLDHHYGAELHYAANTPVDLMLFGLTYAWESVRGEKPYYVPAGASSPIGNIGYVNAAFEIRNQVEQGEMPEPDYVLTAAGSLGTASGLQLGFKLAGMKTRVAAVQVSMPWYITAGKFASMIANINAFMRRSDPTIPEVKPEPEELIMLEGYLGKCYAAFTPECVSIIEIAKNLEGLKLDPTYTSKTLAGGLDWLRSRGEQGKVVLFMDTFNSVDLSPQIVEADYMALPTSFYRYFEKPTQEEELAEKAL
jgi:1-aminocyclopropane-1-carboxylate deaminase/D-cysteine desulfhydrase-like pyridoxal-dependent ACC family enzyme